jgi:hypothetical protein
MRFLFLAALVFGAAQASAVQFAFDVDVFYFTDSFANNGTTSSYGRTMWDVAPMVGLDNKGTILIGWNYDSMSFTDTPSGTTTSLTVTDMGPKIVYYFNKSRTWVVAFTYDLITKANYSSGSTTAELRGTAMKGELGYMPEMFENIFIGAKINYYKATFSEQVVSTTLTKVTDGRTLIYPTFSATFRF